MSSGANFGLGSDFKVTGLVLDNLEKVELDVEVATCAGHELRSEHKLEEELDITEGGYPRGKKFLTRISYH